MMAAAFTLPALSPHAVSPLADDLATDYFVSAERAKLLALADLSRQPRCGCKGPGAAPWLAALGVPIPAAPNSAAALAGGGRVLRLGLTEFLVEGDAALVERLQAAPRAAGVYPVLRQDACLLLAGERLGELLLQSCNVNFAALDSDSSTVVLTSMVGVGVTVLPENKNGVPSCRVWCDGSYGPYLWRTLRAIAEELGGGAVASGTLASLI
jgi:sarcosine oxidase subunit gamma